MESPGTLPEVLAARSTEIAAAVAGAVGRHVVPSSPWLMAAHERSWPMRTQFLVRCLELSASGGPFSDDDRDAFRNLGVLFARHDVPLSLLIASFDVGIAALTRESWHIASAEHFAEMTEFTGRAAQMVEHSRQMAIHGYLETCAGSSSRSARWVVAEALIGGETTAATGATGERLAPSYLVLACAVPDPARVDPGQVAAVHRYIESVPGALHYGDLSTLVVLLPAEDPGRLPEAVAAELAGRLRSLTGQMVYAAQAHRPDIAGIPAALDEACRVLSLVKAIPDADCRLYRMDMLLVELAIARQPDLQRRLAALLAPLTAGPDLRHTLEVLFACNLDRERTAKELCIHRRTLRYRMDRIRKLSGIDLDSAQGIALFRAALTASRLPSGEFPLPRPDEDATHADPGD